ncbi:phosphoribosylaminoimidazolesuccinocarboxamide synthase [Psychroflexus sp. YR1-1]|uniref:Phosphoribosylaminoimidazole-succinocarboxamide synthase n=1 Tax=Psychroflexus aurantiacus TaxID=2709310 RepID=A0A6B3QYB5_9FLAO|nr:phosphoribosylaminoimidazolesuccinocarboxamide synthase [Psychroflexus aurantiacus]NEV93263.1 phosphoribosylaminoimidazolesuccinocarboxamide synthase [Psychroflexus aurantiacus]
MRATLLSTQFQLPGQEDFYKGKVREVYSLKNNTIVIVATDRLSAFDVVLPQGIPYKGQILNEIASEMLHATEDLVPNWLEAVPDPNVSVGVKCEPFKVEMVVRNYLVGHAAREYFAGKRELCGVEFKEGLKLNDKFDAPIITPTTKAEQGDHDQDISREEILNQGIVSQTDYEILEDYALKLFQRGTELADKRGLLLVDTKYEFGKTPEGKIVVIDEIHTPDSSRYFYKEGYEERQAKGEKQKQLSKEFVREWLMANGFQGKEGQKIPELTPEVVNSISERYIELYEKITGKSFQKADVESIETRILSNIEGYLKR